MNRRGFLSTCLALSTAPMLGKAEILMPVRRLILPDTVMVPLYFDLAPAGDVCIASVWVKTDGAWRQISQRIYPGQRPHVMVPMPRSFGVAELWNVEILAGETMKIALHG